MCVLTLTGEMPNITEHLAPLFSLSVSKSAMHLDYHKNHRIICAFSACYCWWIHDKNCIKIIPFSHTLQLTWQARREPDKEVNSSAPMSLFSPLYFTASQKCVEVHCLLPGWQVLFRNYFIHYQYIFRTGCVHTTKE